jgi:hypothetical protein
MLDVKKKEPFQWLREKFLSTQTFRFESYLLPSQCAERIEKLSFSSPDYSLKGVVPFRKVSLVARDNNAYDFQLQTVTHPNLGYSIAHAQGHIDVDYMTSKTILNGKVGTGLGYATWIMFTLSFSVLLVWLSTYSIVLLFGLLPLIAVGVGLSRKAREEREILLEEICDSVTRKKV